MLRHRQTQTLQRNLEKRFGKLLKPFGIRPADEDPKETVDEKKQPCTRNHYLKRDSAAANG